MFAKWKNLCLTFLYPVSVSSLELRLNLHSANPEGEIENLEIKKSRKSEG
jgi:hypothetical protein